jgi:hypothetical protein
LGKSSREAIRVFGSPRSKVELVKARAQASSGCARLISAGKKRLRSAVQLQIVNYQVRPVHVPFSEKLKDYGIAPNPEPEVLWNFEKFLVSRTGEVVNRFAPDTVPDEPALVAAIEAELAKS